MNRAFFVFFLMLTNFIFSQESIKSSHLSELDEFPIFDQFEIPKSKKNSTLLFQAKLQQFFITNIGSKSLIYFKEDPSYVLHLKTTLDGSIKINNLSEFTNVQKEALEKVLEKLSIKKGAQKNGQDVAIEFSIPLQIKFTEIKTIN
ncbi:MAG: hypothetical protein NWS84_08875 [Polaribacter sp.]|jgi:hypothetical protein|nr:hypothetical protein [Polaribacter sp.]MDP4704132.1 hypothetical protein [Polaribacter sp.]